MRGLAVAALLCAGFACGDEGAKKPTAPPDAAPAVPPVAERAPAAADAGTKPPAIPAVIGYPDTVQGLADLIGDLLAAVEDRSREADAARLVHSLRLPDAEAWFRTRFGDRRGRRIAADYVEIRDDLGSLALALRDANKRGLATIDVVRLSQPGDADAVGYQVAALESATTPTALYSVRMRRPDTGQVFHVWSFVHNGGTFRFVGKMMAAGRPKLSPSGRDVNEFTRAVADRVLAAENARSAPP